MKKDLKYYGILLLALLLFIFYELNKPKELSWQVTLSKRDKNPYGTYVLNDLLPQIIKQEEIIHSNKTLFELAEEGNAESLLILCQTFAPDKADFNALFEMLDAGANVFVASSAFGGKFRDTLNLQVSNIILNDSLANLGMTYLKALEDSTPVHFVNPHLGGSKYYYKKRTVTQYFSSIDTLQTRVVAKNKNGNPVLITTDWGKGKIILSTLPLCFTNYYMLWGRNHEFASSALSYLPEDNLIWTEYYQLGRQESGSPLRFVLSNESLRWTYYITLLTLLVFVFFEMKRRQRIIPIIKPPENTTLEFAETVGNLYYNHGDHLNLARKKILFFKEQIRTRYYVQTNVLDDDFYRELSNKTGQDPETVKSLFQYITEIESRGRISEAELFDLSKKLDEFLEN